MRFFAIAVAAALSASFAFAAHATGISPLNLEMSAAGTGARSQFAIDNTSAVPMPVEITIQKLAYTEDGKDTLTKGGDDLLITPATALIPPGSKQTFRVQWVGAPDLAASQSFLLMASQLPVRDKSGHSVVQVVTGFGAILNVAPVKGAADLKLVNAAPAKLPDGKPALSILVANPTSTHALISNATLHVDGQTVNAETMRVRVGIGVVEPGKRRRFLVPLEAAATATKVSLDYMSAP